MSDDLPWLRFNGASTASFAPPDPSDNGLPPAGYDVDVEMSLDSPTASKLQDVGESVYVELMDQLPRWNREDRRLEWGDRIGSLHPLSKIEQHFDNGSFITATVPLADAWETRYLRIHYKRNWWVGVSVDRSDLPKRSEYTIHRDPTDE